MKKHLKEDFLNWKIIDSQFKRVRNLPGENFKERRKLALEKKEKKQQDRSDRVIAPIDFNPILPKISDVFAKHYRAMIFKKPELKSTFPNPPMAALRQPPNMRKILCRASLYPISRGEKFMRNSHRNAPGWKKCGKGSTTRVENLAIGFLKRI